MSVRSLLALAALAAAAAFPARAADDAAALLRAADRWRLSNESMQVETQVQILARNGSPAKERLYTVFAQARHRSLVLMRSPAEAGQKLLMLGDDFWLLMPGSQRPIRITPMQKLLGDASTGDVATLSWADDYAGTVVDEEPCAEGEPARCTHLSLRAARRAASYQRIELWIGSRRREPVRAELYLQSDKLAKRARFVLDPSGSRVDEMILRDELGTHEETRVRYLSRRDRVVPGSWMNPMFLAHDPALE